MRKNMIFSLILAVCVIVLAFACVDTNVSNNNSVTKADTQVLTVAKNNTVESPVLEARFLNMLNHNFVYNDMFYDDAALVEESLLALLDVAEDSYIAETYVKDYVFNMYGKIYDGFELEGPEKEGYVYVAPRGYSVYTHKIVSITDNMDGSYTVMTNVSISYEDGSEETLKAETLFIEASDSAFGYNILYSDIIETASNNVEC